MTYFRFAPVASLLVATACATSTAAAAPSQPNVVVFLIDDMGVMDSSLPFLTDEAGNSKRYPLNDYYRTPNMERLAARGIRFSNFYSMSVCSPPVGKRGTNCVRASSA